MGGSKALSGFAWSVGERIATQGSLFVISLALARILGPNDYGTVAMLLVFINIADVFVTNGLSESLIQKNQVSESDYSTVFVCGVVTSILLYALLFFAAPAIGEFYGNASMPPLLRVLALRIPLSSMNAIQRAHVAKRLDFKKYFFASSLAAIFAGVLGIISALLGVGTYALAVQQIGNMLLSTLFLYVQTCWRPSFKYSNKSARELLPTGFQLAGANLINVLYSEGRSLIIGKYYSADSLAYYNRGNQFPSLIVSNINAPISNVMLPVLSAANNDNRRLRELTRKSMGLSAFLLTPCMGLLFVCSEPLVRLLLSDAWIPSVPYLQIGCLFYLFQPMQTMNWQALKAAGRSDLCLKLELVKKAICFSVLFLTVPFGVMAIAVGSAVSGFISMVINMLPNGKVIGYSFAQQMIDILPSLVFTVLSGALAYCMAEMLRGSAIVELILECVVMLLVYITLALVTRNKNLIYIVEKINRKIL